MCTNSIARIDYYILIQKITLTKSLKSFNFVWTLRCRVFFLNIIPGPCVSSSQLPSSENRIFQKTLELFNQCQTVWQSIPRIPNTSYHSADCFLNQHMNPIGLIKSSVRAYITARVKSLGAYIILPHNIIWIVPSGFRWSNVGCTTSPWEALVLGPGPTHSE